MLRIARMVAASLVLAVSGCAAPGKTPPPPAPAPSVPAAPAVAGSPARINAAGLQIIKASEGLRLTPYQDGGHWYVGYGHAIAGPGPTISEAEAERLLQQDLSVCEAKVSDTVHTPLTANAFSALVSLCYNLGWQTFAKSSLVGKLNAGDTQGAADAFLFYDKTSVNGVKEVQPRLRKRREDERALFLQGA